MQFDEKVLADLVKIAVSEAIAERRQEIPVHTCICSDTIAKAKHEADHEIIRRIGKFLDRVENAKWSFFMLVITAAVSSAAYALWEGVKSVVKK
jgi:hypothetical protein